MNFGGLLCAVFGAVWLGSIATDNDTLRTLLELNPMTHVIEGYHAAIFTGELIQWKRFGVTGLVAVATFAVGYWVFDRLRDSFAEEV